MRFSVRLVALLASSVVLVTFVITWNDVRAVERARQIALEEGAASVTRLLRDLVEPLLTTGAAGQLDATIADFSAREHLAGVAIHDLAGRALAATSSGLAALRGPAPVRCVSPERACGASVASAGREMYVYTTPVRRDHTVVASLSTFSDDGADSTGRGALWLGALIRVVPQVLLIAFVAVGVVKTVVLRPIARTARWMKDLRLGRATARLDPHDRALLDPISTEAASLADSLMSARATAQEEARLREAGDSLWTAERLRAGVQSRLAGNPLVVVSNREPYEHVRRGGGVEARVPASGLVTALEPVLHACAGTWIAHGSGDADRDVVDGRDHVRVPPDDPCYSLRRVWLTRDEEDGYYYGFSNEGLWPLCHIAFTRPIFRASDWEQYQRVNLRFAQTVLEELEGAAQPFVLVQDYHFALVPGLVKDARPDARIAVFWHIPWPNPEAFGVCPWQREILDGLLGADIVSFHIQAHCSNFLRTIDRMLECRIEWERSAVNRRAHVTLMRSHPISVAFDEPPEADESVAEERAATRRSLGAEGPGHVLAVGVDRIDYTKGLIERLRAIECLLAKDPDLAGRFSFVQVGAPSRTQIKRYQDLVTEVGVEAGRINRRFETGGWKPIALRATHHDQRQIRRLYRAADVCLVTSLHDGMNLVAKEFVASRADEEGVLVLSQFAGASCELRDALLVNPYDVEQLAEAIRAAIEMPAGERRARMRHMRRIVREHNVYRWAADLVSDLAEVRREAAEPAASG
jgi:trehalose 6-phosphate synthase